MTPEETEFKRAVTESLSAMGAKKVTFNDMWGFLCGVAVTEPEAMRHGLKWDPEGELPTAEVVVREFSVHYAKR